MAQSFHVSRLLFLLLCAMSLLLGACSDGANPLVASKVASSEEKPEKTLAALLKSAESGDAEAQAQMGVSYRYGIYTPKDEAKAADWYQKAATQGHAGAQFNLGKMNYYGEGIPKDVVKATEWFQRAATQGLADAQAYLGVLYAHGEGVPKDATKAVEWIQKAATQGHANAQYNLGKAYYDGVGAPKDLIKAIEWFQRAATQDDTDAQFALGVMYSKGKGVAKDAAKALEWYRKAATLGHASAQFNLALSYHYGEGVSKDVVLSYVLTNLAAGAGLVEAEKVRSIMERELPANALAEAQRISSNWKKGQMITREGRSFTPSSSSSATPGALSKQDTGTAFLVAKTGQAITNHHVTNGCKEVRIQGRDGVAKLITSDAVNDLALIQVTGAINATASLNAEPSKLRQGEDVVVYGFPLNSILSAGGNFTPGVVSAMTGLGNNTNQIQITAPIQPGSSGSSVLNKKGEVVGVVSMKLSDSAMAKATGQVGQNVNFAVSGQTLKTFLDTNQVPYTSGGGFFSREKSTADLAEEARKWTLLVECWK
ncbi:MAG: tetratricopeptide repeat-containing serine protease family protein [Rugosibacter sp.]|nr:tetratricopeptide repeat-containing serine protease family protein [Rugosibacter sp.]